MQSKSIGCQQRGTLTAGSGAADFFGNHKTPKVVNASDNAGCFHILSPFLVGTPVPGCPRTPQERCPYDCFTNYDAIICKRRRFILIFIAKLKTIRKEDNPAKKFQTTRSFAIKQDALHENISYIIATINRFLSFVALYYVSPN